MKKESNKNWTTCLRLNTGDGSPRVFLLNSHFLGSVPKAGVLVFCLRAKRSGVGWSCKKYLLQCLILHIILCKWQCPHPNPSHCEGFCRTFHVPSGVPVQRSISERSVSYPMCFANLPLPQQNSLSFRGCR